MLFNIQTIDNFIYLLDNYWHKAYFGGFASGKDGLKTRGIDIPKEIHCNGCKYEVIEILDSALVCSYYLTYLTIPNTIKRIGEYSLHRCTYELKELILPNSIKSIGDHAFDGCRVLERVSLPENLDIIPSHCFYDCTNLSNLRLPEKLLKISDNAFYACKGLTDIDIPSSVVEIGDCAFAFCNGLKSITLPKNLQYIDVNAFMNDSQIENIISLNPTPPLIIKDKFDKFPFNYYFEDAKLFVPKNSVNAYKKAIDWSEFKEISGI